MVTVSDNKRCKTCNREELEQHGKNKTNQSAVGSSYAALNDSSDSNFRELQQYDDGAVGARQFYTPHDVPAVLSWGALRTWQSDTQTSSKDAGSIC